MCITLHHSYPNGYSWQVVVEVETKQTERQTSNDIPCPLSRSHSTLGGLQPQTQQLGYADAAISGVPGPSSVPHLQIQEVHTSVITSTCCTYHTET